MRCSGFAGATVVALGIAAAVAFSVGDAVALPLAGQGAMAVSVQTLVSPAAHKHKQWYWKDGWWRHGPWADHGVYGMVVTRRAPTGLFRPWDGERLRRCAARHPSFDPATGTYVTSRGKRRICR